MNAPSTDGTGPEPHGAVRPCGDPVHAFQRRPLIVKLTLLVGLTLAALIAVLLAAGFYFGRETMQKEIDAHLSAVASSRQDMVEAYLAQLKQRAELLADHGEFRGLIYNLKIGKPDTVNQPYAQGLLNELTDHRTTFSASLADWNGHVLMASQGTETGEDVSANPLFLTGLVNPCVGLPQARGARFEAVLAAPIRGYGASGKNIGVLLMTVDISPLGAAVRDTTGLGETGEVVLGVREGNTARTLFPPRYRAGNVTIPLDDIPALAAALAGREFLGTTRDYRGQRVLAAAVPINYAGWGLVTKMDASEAYAPIAHALRYILLYGALAAVAGLGAAYLLARSIARPVLRLVQAADRVAGGDYDTPVPVQSADEFGVLTTRFNEMTAAIRSRGAERDAKEEALRESEARLKSIGDRVPDSTIYEYGMRPDGTFFFVYLSAGIERSTTYSPAELFVHPQKLYETVLSEDLADMMLATEDSARDLSIFDHQVRRRMPDGTIRWFHSRSVPRRLADGTTIWDGVETDVTAARRAAEALRASDEERQRVETKLLETQKLESLGVLAGGIAHDFNNLLTGVIGNASLARLDLPLASPLIPLLDQIEQAAQHAADLCRQMLAYAGKGRFIVEDVDLSALVRETTHLLESSIAKGVVLRFHLTDPLPAVSADATQLRQVVMNLVINASEAIGTRSGSVQISTGLVHADRAYLDGTFLAQELPEGTYVHLEVSDNGHGMPPETITKIFDPFFTTKFTGRGLGLAAVLGIVRGHKGTLKVYSEPAKGTSFKILFPCAAAPAAAHASPKTTPDLWRGSGVVLVVDDEETVRITAERMLQSFGFTVLIAHDGREAIERFRATADIRAVLLDLTMPHLDGEGTFRELRLLNPEVRVLLMSGFNEREAIHRFIGQGLAGFLQKPFRAESLRERMKEILA